jgi:transposase
MWTLGIDVAKYKHNATLIDENGRAVFRNLSFQNNLEGLNKLLERIRDTGQSPAGVTVGMEATGHYWILLFQHLTAAGFDVKLINPIVTRARRNITVRGSKTDAADSFLIARLLRETGLKVSAVPSDETEKLRTLTRLRFECNQEATAEKLRLTALLDVVFPEYKDHFSDVFGSASREILSQFPTAEQVARVDVRRLTSLLSKASRGQMGRQKAVELKNAAQNSFACIGSNQILALEIRMIVERLNLVLAHIKELDNQISGYLVEQQALLMTLPGIADVWAPTILAEILPVFNPDRKDGGAAFVAMAGLDPRLNNSGSHTGKAKMSKRGSKYLRTAVMQAAAVAANISEDPMFKAIYDRHIEKGKSHLVAVSHVANKMLHVIFSVLKNKKPYEPHVDNAVSN